MATYVNNLRLKEIGTGDESGTWGTSTNTNLELIGEALGFGTEGITTNADTHTTTVADGSADEGRALYIKYTGTLDSACTITIGPNTLKRVHIIENGTSGSQNIIISQGSGANVTIPPGDTKAVYLDGAGSGAAVVDAFASLNVVDLKVQDDLTVTDDATIGGRVIIDDATDATSTTDGSLQTDGGLSVAKDAILGNDVKLLTDSSVLSLGVGSDVTITHDGTTGVTLAANPITLDSAGDITLDADGGDIIFKDGGTSLLEITNSSSDVVFNANVSDKDIIFKGNDGGSATTMLTLDSSDAGSAIFNHDVYLGSDGAILNIGNDNDLKITHDGTNGDFESAGNLTMDIAGELVLDVDLQGEGNGVLFQDGGTSYGNIYRDNNDFILQSVTSDEDFIIKGNDGGSTITACTFDMSAAGAATFNNDVTAFSDKRLKTDISNIENGLDKVMRMQGVHYKRNDIEDAKEQIGVLAQDMEAIVPEVVLTADDEMQTKSVDYGKLCAVLIEAIKDLKAEIDELKKV